MIKSLEPRTEGRGLNACSLLLSIVVLVGCSKPSSGTLTGKVTLNGEPVALGTIAFFSDDGGVVSSSIHDGRYRVEKAPLGHARITVQAHAASQMIVPIGHVQSSSSSQPKTPAKFAPIPARYADGEASGLSHEVIAGPQVRDIVLH
jgi:hypothetical protein